MYILFNSFMHGKVFFSVLMFLLHLLLYDNVVRYVHSATVCPCYNALCHVASFGRFINTETRKSSGHAGKMQCSIFVLVSALIAAPSLTLSPCSDGRCFLSPDTNKIPFSDLSVAALAGRCHTECALEVCK